LLAVLAISVRAKSYTDALRIILWISLRSEVQRRLHTMQVAPCTLF